MSRGSWDERNRRGIRSGQFARGIQDRLEAANEFGIFSRRPEIADPPTRPVEILSRWAAGWATRSGLAAGSG
jgi:hypothetical protein